MNINALIKTFLTVLALGLFVFGAIWYPMFLSKIMVIAGVSFISIGLYKFYNKQDIKKDEENDSEGKIF